jgi:hypothetical protein
VLWSNRTHAHAILTHGWVAGASDVEELLSAADHAVLYAKIMSEPGPTLPELAVPDYPPKKPESAAERHEEAICVIGCECIGYNDMVTSLESGLEIRDRSYHGVVYKRCFLGSEFVSWAVARGKLQSRAEGVQVGQSLVGSGLFSHVTNDHNLKDAPLFYRLTNHDDIFTLNTRRKWVDRVDKPSVTARICKKMLGNIQGRATNNGEVDFVAMAEDKEWPDFEDAVCEFQKVDLTAMEEDARLALVINIYNMAIVHAMVKVGIAKTNLKRYSFFDSVG